MNMSRINTTFTDGENNMNTSRINTTLFTGENTPAYITVNCPIDLKTIFTIEQDVIPTHLPAAKKLPITMKSLYKKIKGFFGEVSDNVSEVSVKRPLHPINDMPATSKITYAADAYARWTTFSMIGNMSDRLYIEKGKLTRDYDNFILNEVNLSIAGDTEKEIVLKGIILRLLLTMWETYNNSDMKIFDDIFNIYGSYDIDALNAECSLLLNSIKQTERENTVYASGRVEQTANILPIGQTREDAPITYPFYIIPYKVANSESTNGIARYNEIVVMHSALPILRRIVNETYALFSKNKPRSIGFKIGRARHTRINDEIEDDDYVRIKSTSEKNWKVHQFPGRTYDFKFVPTGVNEECTHIIKKSPRDGLRVMDADVNHDKKGDDYHFGVMSQLAYAPYDVVQSFDFSKIDSAMAGITYINGYDFDEEWKTQQNQYGTYVKARIYAFYKRTGAASDGSLKYDIYIVCRGSQTTTDWHGDDAAIARARTSKHVRFRNLKHIVKTVVNDFYESVGKSSDAVHHLQIYSTGHSLGGFKALMIAYYSVAEPPITIGNVHATKYVYPIAFNPYCGVKENKEAAHMLALLPRGNIYRIYGNEWLAQALTVRCDNEDVASAVVAYNKSKLNNLNIIEFPPVWAAYSSTRFAGSLGCIGYCANKYSRQDVIIHPHIMWQFISVAWAFIKQTELTSRFLDRRVDGEDGKGKVSIDVLVESRANASTLLSPSAPAPVPAPGNPPAPAPATVNALATAPGNEAAVGNSQAIVTGRHLFFPTNANSLEGGSRFKLTRRMQKMARKTLNKRSMLRRKTLRKKARKTARGRK